MKTAEELNALRAEVEALQKKIADLTNEELAMFSVLLQPDREAKKSCQLSDEELENVSGGHGKRYEPCGYFCNQCGAYYSSATDLLCPEYKAKGMCYDEKMAGRML